MTRGTPSLDDTAEPDPWQCSVDRLRNLCDGLDVDELLVLSWLVRSRLLWLTRREETWVDTRQLSGRVLLEAERFNAAVRLRTGDTPVDRARKDPKFRQLMTLVTNPDHPQFPRR